MEYLLKENIKLRGFNVDCVSGELSICDVEGNFYKREDGGIAFQLFGGPTGYESFYIVMEDYYVDSDTKILTLEAMSYRGWRACMGTKNRYDRLEIPPSEMEKVLKVFRTLGIEIPIG